MEQDFFTNLPSENIIDILSRLPVRTIVQCKCVCKSWFNLLKSGEFVQSHLSKSSDGLAVFQIERSFQLYKIHEFNDELDLEHHELHYNPITTFNLPYLGLIQGSANGLLFLRDLRRSPNGLYVCNPITREYIELHCPQDFVYSYPQVVTIGFGSSKTTSQYKVVRIFHDCIRDKNTHQLMRIPKSECQVYTFGIGSWRRIELGSPLEYSCRTIGAFLNGNLHWLVYDFEGSPFVSCFDLETEIFNTFKFPNLPKHDRSLLGLFALGDFLCLSDNSSDDEIVVWLMQEYRVEKSWTKEFVISKSPNFLGEYYEVVYPIKIFKDGDILMAWGDFFLFYYSVSSSKAKTITNIDMFELRGPGAIDSILHTSSFLSLASFSMENATSF
ncbi:hypothetical protein ACS0TY_018509 [Phlomoides rotata]